MREIYKNVETRTFKNAIIHLLESNYKLLGSHKVIDMIACDIEEIHRQFYEGLIEPGEIKWVTTSAKNKKPTLGQKAAEYKHVTVKLPYLTKEDIRLKKDGIAQKEHDIKRIERLTRAAKEQNGLLTIAELAAIMNCSTATISTRISEYQKKTGNILPLKGYVYDIGNGTSHKAIIIEHYEKGISPPVIARRTYHSLASVDRYIKDYDKIKFLLRRGLTTNEIITTIGKSAVLIKKYMKMLEKYHPELFDKDKEK